jgi:hypothetical protein
MVASDTRQRFPPIAQLTITGRLMTIIRAKFMGAETFSRAIAGALTKSRK